MNLPIGKYAVLGSGPLAVRGIRDTKDIDLIVAPEIYRHYKKMRGWKLRFAYGNFFLRKGKIELWNSIGFWRSRIDIKKFIERSELIYGVPFVNMQDFICWKKLGFRDKDKRDAQLAIEWLNKKLKSKLLLNFFQIAL